MRTQRRRLAAPRPSSGYEENPFSRDLRLTKAFMELARRNEFITHFTQEEVFCADSKTKDLVEHKSRRAAVDKHFGADERFVYRR